MTIFRHGLTAADQGAMTAFRARLAARPVAITRASYDVLLEQVPSADSVSYTEARIGGVPGVWCAASTSPGKAAVLHLIVAKNWFGNSRGPRVTVVKPTDAWN